MFNYIHEQTELHMNGNSSNVVNEDQNRPVHKRCYTAINKTESGSENDRQANTKCLIAVTHYRIVIVTSMWH